MTLYKTDAVVIKKTALNEADEIITFISPMHGKIKAVAKGLKRIKSSKLGKLELTNHVRLLLAEGRNLDVISQVETIRVFKGIWPDLRKIAVSFNICEMFDKVIEFKECAPQIFKLLYESLLYLDKNTDVLLLPYIIKLKLFEYLGYYPNLENCVHCRKEVSEVYTFFDFYRQGLLCKNCKGTVDLTNGVNLTAGIIKYLNFIKNSNIERISSIKADGKNRKIIGEFTKGYFKKVFDKELSSASFVEKVS